MKFLDSDSSICNFVNRLKTWIDWKNYHNNDKLEYPIECSKTGYPVYNRDQVNDINQDPSPVVVISNVTESINSRIYFRLYRTDKFYIIISNGQWDAEYYNLPIKYINLHSHFYFYEYADYMFNPNRFQFNFKNEYNFDYPKKCLFVSTTGNTKKERDRFIDRLTSTLLTEDYIFRYSYNDIGLPSTEFDLNNGKPGCFDGYSTIKGLESYYHTVSLSLPIDLYNQGYFNLLLEGDIDCPQQFHPTEKIVKVLISGMPFVLVGSPFFLAHIRNLGFKTYSELWDESYDEITDYDNRIDKIINLCNNLIKFNWDENKNKLIEIAQHNRNNFLNLNQILDNELNKIMIQLSNIGIQL